MSSTKKILSITNLKKYFPIAKSSLFQRNQLYVRANEDITLDIYEGETLGIVGESGCGKSTLGRVLLQLYDQTAGTTLYYGVTLDELAPSYVFDTLRHYPRYAKKLARANEKAAELEKKLEQAGGEEKADFYLLQNLNLANCDVKTRLTHIVNILGGFHAIDEGDEGKKLLESFYLLAKKRKTHKEKLHNLEIRIDQLHGRLSPDENDKPLDEKKAEKIRAQIESLTAKKNAMEPELETVEKEIADVNAKLDELRRRYADNEEFAKFEAMRDDGVDLSRLKYNEMRFLRRDLQIIFQDPYSSLNPRFTIGQIIEEGLLTHKFFKAGSPKMRQHVVDTMEKCGLQEYMLHRYPHQFSGGQRQRICIARALAVMPKFVVCDECVSALDVSIQSQIINLLQELKEKEKLTYMFISHDLSVVRYISDRICVMYLGNVVELADAETTFRDPRHPYTVALLSSIPTTDPESLKKERILLEGNIPSPIRPPEGCKFHTRCYMACDKCKRVPPPLTEIEPGHFVACHFPERKLDENGNYLFEMPKTERKSERADAAGTEGSDQ
ncbi:MAG: ATP-binding cassette domain-containing protein [Clostridia bacterium]|nr:ATP-binding cassette domain-containing protein [Clostridia bacterium]